MSKRIVHVVFLSLSVAMVAMASHGGPSPTLFQDGRVVRLQAPAEFLKRVPGGARVRLTMMNPRLGKTSVIGVSRRTFKNGLSISTPDTLRFLPEKGTILILSEDSTDGASCLPPEFGIDCFGSLCFGTTYCLPGPGPGGFQCSCE